MHRLVFYISVSFLLSFAIALKDPASLYSSPSSRHVSQPEKSGKNRNLRVLTQVSRQPRSPRRFQKLNIVKRSERSPKDTAPPRKNLSAANSAPRPTIPNDLSTSTANSPKAKGGILGPQRAEACTHRASPLDSPCQVCKDNEIILAGGSSPPSAREEQSRAIRRMQSNQAHAEVPRAGRRETHWRTKSSASDSDSEDSPPRRGRPLQRQQPSTARDDSLIFRMSMSPPPEADARRGELSPIPWRTFAIPRRVQTTDQATTTTEQDQTVTHAQKPARIQQRSTSNKPTSPKPLAQSAQTSSEFSPPIGPGQPFRIGIVPQIHSVLDRPPQSGNFRPMLFADFVPSTNTRNGNQTPSSGNDHSPQSGRTSVSSSNTGAAENAHGDRPDNRFPDHDRPESPRSPPRSPRKRDINSWPDDDVVERRAIYRDPPLSLKHSNNLSMRMAPNPAQEVATMEPTAHEYLQAATRDYMRSQWESIKQMTPAQFAKFKAERLDKKAYDKLLDHSEKRSLNGHSKKPDINGKPVQRRGVILSKMKEANQDRKDYKRTKKLYKDDKLKQAEWEAGREDRVAERQARKAAKVCERQRIVEENARKAQTQAQDDSQRQGDPAQTGSSEDLSKLKGRGLNVAAESSSVIHTMDNRHHFSSGSQSAGDKKRKSSEEDEARKKVKTEQSNQISPGRTATKKIQFDIDAKKHDGWGGKDLPTTFSVDGIPSRSDTEGSSTAVNRRGLFDKLKNRFKKKPKEEEQNKGRTSTAEEPKTRADTREQSKDKATKDHEADVNNPAIVITDTDKKSLNLDDKKNQRRDVKLDVDSWLPNAYLVARSDTFWTQDGMLGSPKNKKKKPSLLRKLKCWPTCGKEKQAKGTQDNSIPLAESASQSRIALSQDDPKTTGKPLSVKEAAVPKDDSKPIAEPSSRDQATANSGGIERSAAQKSRLDVNQVLTARSLPDPQNSFLQGTPRQELPSRPLQDASTPNDIPQKHEPQQSSRDRTLPLTPKQSIGWYFTRSPKATTAGFRKAVQTLLANDRKRVEEQKVAEEEEREKKAAEENKANKWWKKMTGKESKVKQRDLMDEWSWGV